MKSMDSKNFGFNEEKCIFEHCRKVTLFLFLEMCPIYLFRAALYNLILKT
jgi:hypothetical protein